MDITKWDTTTVTDLKGMFDMAVRSDVYIAIDSKKYVTDLLANKLPKLIADKSHGKHMSEALYFRFMGVKWYTSKEEISQVLLYLNDLDSDYYGMVIISEDGITERFGNTTEYGLIVDTTIVKGIRKLFEP